MANWFPSGKFTIILIAGLIIAGAIFLLFKKPKADNNDEKTGQETILQKGGLAQIKEAQLDSDSDGLKDWEEKLWGTDPNSPDTDGDGALDGEELQQGRDPLKKGPDDKLVRFQSLPKEPEPTFQSSKNLTEELARQLVVLYFSQKGKGEKPAISPENVAKDIFNQSEGQILKDEFSEKDFSKFIAPTKENKKIYLNRLGEILENNFKNIKGNEFEILNESLAKGKEEELNKLDSYISAYQKTVSDLRGLAVPENKDYINLHLLLMNIMNNLGKSVAAMKLVFQDQFKMVFGTRWYLNEAVRWKKSEEDFKILAVKDGIAFEKNEGGAFIIK